MNEAQATDIFIQILDDLGIETGDVVYLGVDMAKVPLPKYPAELSVEGHKERARKWCEFLLGILMDRVGIEGSILAPAFTYAYAARREPYIHEASPSETGPFTEYMRTLPEARRSLHPVHSVVGVGGQAGKILDGPLGKAAYGARSVFACLEQHNTKFLCLGASLGQSITYVHHLEQCYGVNHRYTKLFNTPVYKDGEEVPGPWLCFMRYLGVAVEANLPPLEERMRKDKTLRVSERWDYPMQCAHIDDVARTGYAMLEENCWAFSHNEIEVHIESRESSPNPAIRLAARFHSASEDPR